MDVWAALRYAFCHIFCPCDQEPLTARLKLRYGGCVIDFNATGGFMFTIPDDGPTVFNLTLSYVDAKGKPAKVDGVPVWTPPDAALASLAVAADGMSAVMTLVDPIQLGAGQVRIDADADMGAGVKPLVTLGDFEVVAGEAVAGNVSFVPA